MILSPSPAAFAKASELLHQGHLVAFPTETVYGLGADATNPKAVRKIFAAKGRPSHNPLIVHISSLTAISQVAIVPSATLLEAQVQALARFWPGPLSLILPKHPSIAPEVCAGQETIAVRIPQHPVARALLDACALPLAAPSANQFSYISPTAASHVEDSLGAGVALILDGGPCSVGIESTIVSLVHSTPTLLRAGAITVEQLQTVLPNITVNEGQMSVSEGTPLLAPGQLRKHYSPRTPLRFCSDVRPNDLPPKVSLIRFSEALTSTGFDYRLVSTLSKDGDLQEVAQRLFATLREHDRLGLDLILVDRCPENGIGKAIMDRLHRAASNRS